MTTYTLPFAQISRADLPKVGGKGANLGEMTQAGFPVPPGFCVTTGAFAEFMAGISADIYPRLAQISPEDLDGLRRICGGVRDELAQLPLPEAIAAGVVSAWEAAGREHAYAVRSSATAEDLPYASFAGQQDTYLNIRGEKELLAKVKACFISLFTDRAVLYRAQNHFDHRAVSLSVVVQRMVQPEVSGILFTADPITGNRTVASIDASFGLGEALVAGLVSADLYQVDKPSHTILKRQIADKQIAIRSLAGGGTEQVDLPPAERNRPALTDAQIVELARLGSRIERHYGTPQDIEWALADGELYITQSRPITSLYPLPEPQPDDGNLHAYFSFSHFQMMSDPMPPLTISIWRAVLPVGHEEGRVESRQMSSAGGRIYMDFSPILRHPLGRRIVARGIGNADQLAGLAMAEIANRPNFQAKGPRYNPLSLLPRLLPSIGKILAALWRDPPEGSAEGVLRFMNECLAENRQKMAAAPTPQARYAVALDWLQHAFTPIFTWAPQMAAGMIGTGLLFLLIKKQADPDDLAAIGRGLRGNVTTEMGLAVGDLADAARASQALAHLLENRELDPATRLTQAANHPGGDGFLAAWNDFLSIYGSRGPSEIDLSRPRWRENPASLLQMVVNAMGSTAPGSHRQHYQQLQAENEAAARRLEQAASRGLLGWLRGPLVRRMLRVSRHLMPLREHHKFFIIQLLAEMKVVLLEMGAQFAGAGRLDSADEIWFLTLPEIGDALENPALELGQRVAERRAKFERYQHLTPPRVITSDGEIPVVKLERDAPAGALIGSPVSAGVVEGIAKVILDPSAQALQPGEILVAPFTDPGWTPLFVNAGGLITEMGGLMTHGSVVAREYGIPAVVGVVDATKIIKSGQRLRVHGDAGYVEVLA